MKTKTLFYLASIGLCLFLFPQCKMTHIEESEKSIVQPKGLDPTDFEAGKCYEECLISDHYNSFTETYYEYTGNKEAEDVEIETIDVVVVPESTTWVKQKAPDGSIVAKQRHLPMKKVQLTVLKDTTQSKDFRIKKIQRKELVKKGGYMTWKEVVCPNRVTLSLVEQLQSALKERGFEVLGKETSFGTQTKFTLSKFQKANGLPVGYLDFETLEYLRIDLE